MPTPPKPSSVVRRVSVPRRRYFVGGYEVADRGDLCFVDEVTTYEFAEPEPETASSPPPVDGIGSGEEYLTKREAARRLRTTVRTIDEMLGDGRLKRYPLSNRPKAHVRIRASELAEALRQANAPPTTAEVTDDLVSRFLAPKRSLAAPKPDPSGSARPTRKRRG